LVEHDDVFCKDHLDRALVADEDVLDLRRFRVVLSVLVDGCRDIPQRVELVTLHDELPELLGFADDYAKPRLSRACPLNCTLGFIRYERPVSFIALLKRCRQYANKHREVADSKWVFVTFVLS